MSSIVIAVQLLLEEPAVTAIVGQRVYPVFPDPGAQMPYIVVYLVSESEEDLLGGASQLRDGRVSIESVTAGDVVALLPLGEKVIAAMRDKVNYPIANCTVTTRKADSDVTDASQQTAGNGVVSSVRRITDFYTFWRNA